MELKRIIETVRNVYGVKIEDLYNTSLRSRKEKECRWAVAYYTQRLRGGSIRQLKAWLGYNSIRPIQIGLTDFPLVLKGEINSAITRDELMFLEEKLLGNNDKM